MGHGSVVIAAITSCTNTSNPSVMIGAGLLAQKAVERGLHTQPWVKTSLAPGSKVVTAYLDAAGLTPYLDQLRFNTVGYGCTTCIGNSGLLPAPISAAIDEGNLVTVAVLSGNRNFEGRINSDVKANYLMSPLLVVAYALVGRIDVDLVNDPLGTDRTGKPVYLRDVWPTRQEIQAGIEKAIRSEMFRRTYAEVFQGDEHWNTLDIPQGDRFTWEPDSTYIRHPPYFEGMTREAPETVKGIQGARVLAMLGDSVTTDHISPAGSIRQSSPAGKYLTEHGVELKDFNSYGSRRGNHEVMVRGTFANIRLRNLLAPGTEGGVTTYLPTGEVSRSRGVAEVPGRSRPPGHPGRERIRIGVEPGLGRQRAALARRARRHRPELRTYSPFQPGRDGRAAAAIPSPGKAPSRSGSRARKCSRSKARRRAFTRERRCSCAPWLPAGSRGNSPRSRGSTRRTRGITSATAESSPSSCGRCSPRESDAERTLRGPRLSPRLERSSTSEGRARRLRSLSRALDAERRTRTRRRRSTGSSFQRAGRGPGPGPA